MNKIIIIVICFLSPLLACDVPNVTLDCSWSSCDNFTNIYNGDVGTDRVGTEMINGTLTLCVYSPCLTCDAYCIFANDGRFLADGHWACDKKMDANGTYPDGTICLATKDCCMECDDGEGYIYGEYGKAHTSTKFECRDGKFVELAFCAGSTFSIWTSLFFAILLHSFL